MTRYEDEEDTFFESIGRIRRRGDDSRSPSPAQRRESSPSTRGRRVESPDLTFRERGVKSSAWKRARAYHAQKSAPRSPNETCSTQSTAPGHHSEVLQARHGRASDHHTPDTPDEIRTERGQASRVKQPTEDEDLTEDEFEQYQARYGIRHNVSADQILQGTNDEDADDPTLGNRRTQIRLSEDGTIDRRDFDWEGGFRYSYPKDARGRAALEVRRGGATEDRAEEKDDRA
jgi:hypothetical protein